jgi:hypothetical protein
MVKILTEQTERDIKEIKNTSPLKVDIIKCEIEREEQIEKN